MKVIHLKLESFHFTCVGGVDGRSCAARAPALLRCSRRAARRALEGLREALKRGPEGRARSYVTWGERRPCKMSMSRVPL